jgi:pyruvate formate lyase activating enzyme
VELCPAEALCASGRDVTCDELFFEVMRDRDFYGEDGGVTFSGGECLLQADFVSEMLRRFKESGITTAVDTAGYVPYESFEKTLPYTDFYLYDVKCVSAELHRRVVGKDNGLILENFEKLSKSGAKIFVRVPVIPDFNDNDAEIEKIAETVAGKNGILGVTLMPYHTLGKNKYETLGLVAPYNTEKHIDSKVLEDYKEIFRKKGVFIE